MSRELEIYFCPAIEYNWKRGKLRAKGKTEWRDETVPEFFCGRRYISSTISPEQLHCNLVFRGGMAYCGVRDLPVRKVDELDRIEDVVELLAQEKMEQGI
jgi:hypothetical protein